MSQDPPPDAASLPVPDEEVMRELAYALRHDERGKPVSLFADLIARLAAERLTRHLERCGFVVNRGRRGAPPHSAG